MDVDQADQATTTVAPKDVREEAADTSLPDTVNPPAESVDPGAADFTSLQTEVLHLRVEVARLRALLSNLGKGVRNLLATVEQEVIDMG